MKRACVVVAMVAAMAALPAAAQTTLWVEDQNGKLLGQWISDDTVWAEVGSFTGLITLSQAGLGRTQIYWDQDGCTGNPYFWAIFSQNVQAPRLAVSGTGDLYYATGSATTTVTLESYTHDGSGQCFNTGIANSASPATLVQAGFAAQFTPPFRIRAESQPQEAPAAVSAVGPAGLAALAAVIAVLGAAVLVGRRLAA